MKNCNEKEHNYPLYNKIYLKDDIDRQNEKDLTENWTNKYNYLSGKNKQEMCDNKIIDKEKRELNQIKNTEQNNNQNNYYKGNKSKIYEENSKNQSQKSLIQIDEKQKVDNKDNINNNQNKIIFFNKKKFEKKNNLNEEKEDLVNQD